VKIAAEVRIISYVSFAVLMPIVLSGLHSLEDNTYLGCGGPFNILVVVS
jgi:hypothetical protein